MLRSKAGKRKPKPAKKTTAKLCRDTQSLGKRLASKAVLQFGQLFLRLSGLVIAVCPLGFA